MQATSQIKLTLSSFEYKNGIRNTLTKQVIYSFLKRNVFTTAAGMHSTFLLVQRMPWPLACGNWASFPVPFGVVVWGEVHVSNFAY